MFWGLLRKHRSHSWVAGDKERSPGHPTWEARRTSISPKAGEGPDQRWPGPPRSCPTWEPQSQTSGWLLHCLTRLRISTQPVPSALGCQEPSLPAPFQQAMPTASRTGSTGSKPIRTVQSLGRGRAGCKHISLGALHRRWGQQAHARTRLSPGVWHPLTTSDKAPHTLASRGKDADTGTWTAESVPQAAAVALQTYIQGRLSLVSISTPRNSKADRQDNDRGTTTSHGLGSPPLLQKQQAQRRKLHNSAGPASLGSVPTQGPGR